jgi:hypothetical protein
MAGYVKGSKAWLNFVTERILFIGDLLISPLTNEEEKRKLVTEQAALVLHMRDYYENLVDEK